MFRYKSLCQIADLSPEYSSSMVGVQMAFDLRKVNVYFCMSSQSFFILTHEESSHERRNPKMCG